MSTLDPSVLRVRVGELHLANAQLPTPGATPQMPAAAASTPGIAGAAARVPGAPTLPDGDPVSLTNLIQSVANDLFAVPVGTSAVPAIADASSIPSASSPATPGQPAPHFALAPFESPLDFQSVVAAPGNPFAAIAFPLLHSFEPAPEPVLLEETARTIETPAYEISPTQETSLRSLSGTAFDAEALKREFPILGETVNGKPLVWLDNAATTQKPRAVIERLSYYYERENSNIHRAAHTLAARATDAYETARESVRRFLNAPSVREVVFVRGATEGINLVAQSWGRRNVEPGDEIVVTSLEHHANIVPWQQLCSERNARLRVVPVDDRGQVILEEYEKLLGPKTRLVAFTQVSNALGTITPAREMIEMAHRHGARVLLDGAQAVSHMRVDVQALGCDFYVFSGHKVFAPTGIGVVFGRSEILDAMPPWQGGGNMIQDVTFERTLFAPAPARFEAGTGNIADAVGLGAALDWLSRVGIDRVDRYEHELLVYGTERLRTVPGLELIGTAPEKAGVISFILEGQKTEEVGGMLDREGIAVRSGHHCAQPILRRFGLEATVRASLAPYNTREDLDALCSALHRIQAGRASMR
jgi:cysteine desulfurase / selenocysteine lyase